MMELSLAIAISVACFGFGLIGGLLLHYWGEYKPLSNKYDTLVHTLTNMKKQGFVPMFDIEQPQEVDPSDGIDES